jgi:hypothetical protein
VVNDILELLKICIETHFKTLAIDGIIWTQVDGCPIAIGKSISGEIAQIYMNWFEKEYILVQIVNSNQWNGKE